VHPVQIAHERDDRIKRLAGKIDRVLVDAPCSGLGTLRRNPDLKWRQSPESIAEMRVKQGAILASAARLLKPGGRLVYATCSLLEVENEDVVREFDAAMPTVSSRFRRPKRWRASTSAPPTRWSRARTCGSGRTGTGPTAFSRRSGSAADGEESPRRRCTLPCKAPQRRHIAQAGANSLETQGY
jgi:16S rRNA C967 or C1407 C5-methylase (RsmB/RsmF family)